MPASTQIYRSDFFISQRPGNSKVQIPFIIGETNPKQWTWCFFGIQTTQISMDIEISPGLKQLVVRDFADEDWSCQLALPLKTYFAFPKCLA